MRRDRAAPLRSWARDHLPKPALDRLRAARRAYRRVRGLPAPGVPPGPAARPVARAEATLFDRLSRGASLDDAAVATARDLVAADGIAAAVSFADALAARPDTATAGHLAAGVVAVHRSLPELAAAEFAQVPPAAWRAHAPGEYLDAAYRTDRVAAVTVMRQLLAEQSAEIDAHGWFQVLRYAFAAGELELVRQAFRRLVDAAGPEPPDWAAAEIRWLRPWIDCEHAATAEPPPEGQIPFALIDYRQPSRAKTSKNIGDHIQTLAAIGHLARHRNVRLHGPDELADFVTQMQRQVRPDRRLDTPAADVRLYTAHRDASNYQAFPEGTWTLAFGWYMHPLFGLRHDFPLHPNLRPILVSFHCNKRELLSAEAIEYLRRYGPVGCRDWTTVDLLVSLGVPAFFSGCLTTTVDTLFADSTQPARRATIYVDMPPDKVPPGADTAKHSYGAVKRRELVDNLRDAVDLLRRYREGYTKLVTSRLHCYLPARSLGLTVDFQPKNRADVRFNGLIGIDDAAFAAIRDGMLERLEPVLTAILAGRPEPEVYRIWREVNADDVAAAEARHTDVPPLPAPSLDVSREARRIRAAAVASGPETSGIDIVVPVNADDVGRLRHTLTSVLNKTSRPVRLTLPAWGCGEQQRVELAEAFPEVSMRWLPVDRLTRDTALLALPELLGDLDRVVVLPPAAVVLDAIAELADTDLDGHPLAARTSLGSASSGFGRLYRAARRLHPDAAAAHELYRRMHALHVFDFDAFDTDVLVLDLARMRADDVPRAFLPYLERFGLHTDEALMLYAGPNRVVLAPEWAHAPVNERLVDPRLVHWPGRAKPWRARYVAGRELWEQLTEPDPQ